MRLTYKLAFYTLVSSLPPKKGLQDNTYVILFPQKIRNEKVNEEAELRAIAEKAAVAFSSILDFIKQQLSSLGVPAILNLNFVSFFIHSWMPYGSRNNVNVPRPPIRKQIFCIFLLLREIKSKAWGIIFLWKHKAHLLKYYTYFYFTDTFILELRTKLADTWRISFIQYFESSPNRWHTKPVGLYQILQTTKL